MRMSRTLSGVTDRRLAGAELGGRDYQGRELNCGEDSSVDRKSTSNIQGAEAAGAKDDFAEVRVRRTGGRLGRRGGSAGAVLWIFRWR